MTTTTNTNRIHYLLRKHFDNDCSPNEKAELNLLINSLQDKRLKTEFRLLWDKYSSDKTLSEEDSQLMLTTILSDKKVNLKIAQRKSPNRFISIRTISVAASLLILISFGIYISKTRDLDASASFVAKAIVVSPAQPTSHIRNISLPDGTSVILKAGSTLYYPKAFTGKTREVALKGEAYFDVKHMDTMPFIIHTGSVKTTVLGTAFDIKAWPQQKTVTVSVTRGKVKVEDNRKILAVLTVNQQASYDLRDTAVKQQKVNAEELVIDWAKEDLHFESETLESIVQVLSNRYGKNIRINSASLSKTQIVSSFTGTESLENILEILCAINKNAQFVEKNNEIVISENN